MCYCFTLSGECIRRELYFMNMHPSGSFMKVFGSRILWKLPLDKKSLNQAVPSKRIHSCVSADHGCQLVFCLLFLPTQDICILITILTGEDFFLSVVQFNFEYLSRRGYCKPKPRNTCHCKHTTYDKNTLFANFRPRSLYQAKSSMTQYNLHDIHLSLTKASALICLLNFSYQVVIFKVLLTRKLS